MPVWRGSVVWVEREFRRALTQLDQPITTFDAIAVDDVIIIETCQASVLGRLSRLRLADQVRRRNRFHRWDAACFMAPDSFVASPDNPRGRVAPRAARREGRRRHAALTHRAREAVYCTFGSIRP